MPSCPRLWYLGHQLFPCEGGREGRTNLHGDTAGRRDGREERGPFQKSNTRQSDGSHRMVTIAWQISDQRGLGQIHVLEFGGGESIDPAGHEPGW